MATHSSILTWRIPGQRSLAGYSPWGCTESHITEQLTHTHTHTHTHTVARGFEKREPLLQASHTHTHTHIHTHTHGGKGL